MLGLIAFLYMAFSLSTGVNAQCVLPMDDNVQISLSEDNCTATLTQEMFLTNDGATCTVADHYEFEVRTANGATVLVPKAANVVIDHSFLGGTFMIKLYAVNAGGATINSNTGLFTVVDQVPPTLECFTKSTTISGELATTDLTFTRTSSSGPTVAPACNGASGTGVGVYYDVQEVVVSKTGSYTFALNGAGAPAAQLFVQVYADEFDPTSLCTNFLYDNFAPALGGNLTFSLNLTAYEKYYLVTTSVLPGQVGLYNYTVTPPSNGLVYTENPTCTFDIYCYEDINSVAILGFDNCTTPTSVVWTNEVVTENNCVNGLPVDVKRRIVRTYKAVDPSGNLSEPSTVTINVHVMPDAVFYSGIIFPENYSCVLGNPISCSAGFPLDLTYPTHPAPSYSGWPQLVIDGDTTELGQTCISNCDLSVSYTDVEVTNTCSPCTKRILRTWTITESNCLVPPRTRVYIQTIDVKDITPPVVTCPANVKVNTNQFTCNANYKFPVPTVTDDCQPASNFEWDITVDNPLAPPVMFVDNANLNNAPTKTIGAGVNTVTYTVYDGCTNSSTCTFTVTVEDKVQPVAICQQYTILSLTADGEAQLPASAVNSGSYDNCSGITLKIKRMEKTNDPFRDYVTYNCNDLASQPWTVVLQCTDAAGNVGSCMVNVGIQDKLGPAITCPADQRVACDYNYEPTNLRKYFGWPTATDNCSVTVAETDSTTTAYACYNSTIKKIVRKFTATDNGNRTANCEQKIEFIRTSYFGFDGNGHTTPNANGQITWPRDTSYNTCLDKNSATVSTSKLHPNQSGYPVLQEFACDQVGFSYSDFIAVDNDSDLDNNVACFKIIRTWTVIDDCHKLDGTFAKWVHDQVIFVTNNVAPVLSAISNKTVCSYDSLCESGHIDLAYTATDDCTQVEDLRWRYRLDYGNNNPINKWDYTSPIFNGGSLNASGDYAIGTYKILWEVWDQCGNKTSKEQLFTIQNCKKPTPVCKGKVVVELTNSQLGGPTAFLMDTCLNCCSYHVCGYDLVFSFSADTSDHIKWFGCNEVANDQQVKLYVTAILPDGTTTQDYCNTVIDVQDNNHLCPSIPILYGTVSGNIKTKDNIKLQDVTVKLAGSEMNDVKSNANGEFMFPQVSLGSSYTVTPISTTDYLNGLSTLDIVLIQKEILGLKKFDSSYKFIAADINNDKKVTASDIQSLRKLILGQKDKFENNNSWRFFTNSNDLSGSENPLGETLIETYPFSKLNDNINVPFTAIKIGDISGDAIGANLAKLEIRNGQNIKFLSDEKEFKTGDIVEIPVYADNASIIGFQGTFKFNVINAEFVGMEGKMIEDQSIHFASERTSEGLLPVSCNINSTLSNTSEPMFVIKFKALKDGKTSQLISLNSEVTRKEAYTADYQVYDVNLKFRNTDNKFELLQNNPNPFNFSSEISFITDKAESYVLKVYDMTGKIMLLHNGMSQIGLNTNNITVDQLKNSGIYYYTIETPNYSATKKMVVLK